MANVGFLLALAFGMAAADDPHPIGECAYSYAEALDDFADGGEAIASAVKTCQAGVSDCATDLMEAVSGLLEGSSAALEAAGCSGGSDFECASDALDISGSSLGISAKIKDLVEGACKSGGDDGRRRRLKDVNSLECAAASAKVLLPVTKLGLYSVFEIRRCDHASEDPDMRKECISVGLELVGIAANIAGGIVDIIDACGHNDAFNAECGGAISELVEESTDLANAAMGVGAACSADKDRLRLYEDGSGGMIKMLQPMQKMDVLPWGLCAMLALMMPFVYRVGKVRKARAIPASQGDQESSLE